MTLSSQLAISRLDLEYIVERARLEYPYETCGMIGGCNGAAKEVVPLPNASSTPRIHFEIERQAMVDTVMRFHKKRMEVVAIYHSHPDAPAIPSELDIASATWPDAVYVIVGMLKPDAPEVQAWSLRGGAATPVTLNVLYWAPDDTGC